MERSRSGLPDSSTAHWRIGSKYTRVACYYGCKRLQRLHFGGRAALCALQVSAPLWNHIHAKSQVFKNSPQQLMCKRLRGAAHSLNESQMPIPSSTSRMRMLINPSRIPNLTRERILEHVLRLRVRCILLLCQFLRDIRRSLPPSQIEPRPEILVFCHRRIWRIKHRQQPKFLTDLRRWKVIHLLKLILGSLVLHCTYPLGLILSSKYVFAKIDRWSAFHGLPNAHSPAISSDELAFCTLLSTT